MTIVGGTVWLEILHYLGIAFWLGSVAMLDFRMMGFSNKVPVAAFHLSAGAYIGLAFTLLTGTIMYLPEMSGYMGNGMFVAKMTMLIAAVVFSLFVHSRYVTHAESWSNASPPLAVRLSGLVSLLLWIGVLLAGRLITYTGFTQG